ncbi:phosphoadenosine phosphosulfate reductase family protein [Paenarthrobacter sp. NPDC089714]|uniref:phosphoadenosine phosphosulfate reductase domain-containing protein n=1 Tax=Paenarthrobacter sp. NPDC089714 TaxID=3364377 RepID=UPI003825D841
MSLAEKIVDARRILAEALAAHGGEHEIVGRAVLFSGGNDSHVLADLMVREGVATHAIHANTTIGIEATREFVRTRCSVLGLPLLEEVPPASYAELVEEQGFPGPAHHFKMYQRLKERGLRQARRRLVADPYKQRVVFLAGRRRAESARRADVPEYEREGSVIWVSPLANWTSEDMAEYRGLVDLPRNEVADALGMSGECLCGAFAEPGELERIEALHPDVGQEIRALEVRLLEAGKVPEERCMWGWGAYRDGGPASAVGPLCSSCDFRSDPSKRGEVSERVREAYARIEARRSGLSNQPALFDVESV